jgi:hypothetical protein
VHGEAAAGPADLDEEGDMDDGIAGDDEAAGADE